MDNAIQRIQACKLCEPDLPLGAKPIIQLSPSAKILLIGQAPGKQAHIAEKSFADQSGQRLRNWLGLTEEQFYSEQLAIMPMGFCYPGKVTSGDKPPQQICSKYWHHLILAQLTNIECTLLVGQYAQQAYLTSHKSVTHSVKNWQERATRYWPLPHPSPRNQPWLKQNPWFESELLPALKQHLSTFW